jgi:hypothetical protein
MELLLPDLFEFPVCCIHIEATTSSGAGIHLNGDQEHVPDVDGPTVPKVRETAR